MTEKSKEELLKSYHNYPTGKENPKEISELAVFWEEVASNLPKSIERSALGDEKIFRAIRTAYPKIRNYIKQDERRRIGEEVIEAIGNFTPTCGCESEEEKGFQKGIIAEQSLIKAKVLEVLK